MGKSCNRARKSARKRIPNEILEEIREKKRNDMTEDALWTLNQFRLLRMPQFFLPIHITKDKKHSLKGPSVTISVEERALHGTDQGVKSRCTSRPPETFADLIECGYKSDEVRETLNAKGILKEDNVV